MGHAVNSNLEKLKYIVEQDSNYNLTKNTLRVNFENTTITVDVRKISNVRINKRRSLVVNYLIIISILGAYLLIDKFIFFDATLHFALNLVTGICIFAALFVSKYSYRLLINNKDFSYNNFKLSKGKFDKWSSSL
jgi:hypothetical protein